MNTEILRMAARLVKPLFLVLSLIVLYRGHNLPGGGFIGGLLAAAGYIFYMLANGVEATLRKMWVRPVTLIAWGLLLAFASGFFALINAEPFMTGQWFSFFGIKLGTPTLFDLGVYFTVIGVLISIMVAILNKETKWD